MVNEPAPPSRLRGWLPMAVGLLALVVGALWTLQGLDVVPGSRMSGVQIWAVIGPVVAVAGLLLVVVGIRLRARGRHPE